MLLVRCDHLGHHVRICKENGQSAAAAVRKQDIDYHLLGIDVGCGEVKASIERTM